MDAATESHETTIDLTQADRAAAVLSTLPRAVASFDVGPGGTATLVTANPAMAAMLGTTIEALQDDPRSFWDHVEDRAVLDAWFASPSEHGEELRLGLHTVDGRTIAAGAVVVSRPAEVNGVVQADLLIEDRRRATDLEEQVADRESALRRLAERTSEAVFHLRLWPRIGVIWANSGTAALFGVTREALLSRPATLFDAIDPDDLGLFERAMQQAVGTTARVSCRLVAGSSGEAGGRPLTAGRSVDIELTPVRGDNGEGVILLCMASSVPAGDLALLHETSLTTVAPRSTALPTEAGALVRHLVATSALPGDQVVVRTETIDHDVDTVSLAAAVEAILSNVRRHTPADTRVEVVVARAINGVLVAVHDTGPGMRWPGGCAAGRYGMADVATLADHGGGGLAAILHAAQRHGGRATIQSSPGQGTTVRLLLHAIVTVPVGTARPLMMG